MRRKVKRQLSYDIDTTREAKCLIARKGVDYVQDGDINFLMTGFNNRIDMTLEERLETVYIAKKMVTRAGTFDEWSARVNGKEPEDELQTTLDLEV